MYKLMLYVLLTIIITHKKSFFKNHKMGRLKLESFFLDNKNKLKVRGKDTCVTDYLWHEVKGKRGFKTYTYEKLSEELIDFAESYPFMSTQERIDWVQECHSNISVHAYTSTYKKFIKHISNTPDIVLTFFVKDHHLHPITDPELKRVASSCNQKGSINLFEHMSELKWNGRVVMNNLLCMRILIMKSKTILLSVHLKCKSKQLFVSTCKNQIIM